MSVKDAIQTIKTTGNAMKAHKKLEWRTVDAYDRIEYVATKYLTDSGWLDQYTIITSEKYGGFNIHGLLRNTGWAKTLKKAKAIAEDDYQRRQRLQLWQEYMETHDPE